MHSKVQRIPTAGHKTLTKERPDGVDMEEIDMLEAQPKMSKSVCVHFHTA